MKKLITVLFILVLGLAACAPAPTEMPTPTSTNTPLPTATPTPSPTPVPTGRRVAFVSNRGDDPQKLDLYILDLDSMEITALNTGFDQVILPQWSPDGKKILFAVAEVWNLYTIDADGSNLTQLTDFSSNNGDWSPDGKRIVFQSDHQNEPANVPDLYMIDTTGGNLTELLDTPDVIDYSPRWSPDGSQIMYISRQSGKDEIFIINADGSDPHRVSDSGDPVTEAVWSPNGNRIALSYGGFGKTDLYVMDPDAISNVVRLTNDKKSNSNPSFSPNGKQVVFASKSSGNWDLWMIDADGGNPTQLTNDEYYDAYPDWSP